jgi:hypothetical protein
MNLGLLDPILPNLGVEWWRPGYGTLGVVVTLPLLPPPLI